MSWIGLIFCPYFLSLVNFIAKIIKVNGCVETDLIDHKDRIQP